MYDTKSLSCAKCGKHIGEVDYDAKIIYSLCGKCSDPFPEHYVIPDKLIKKKAVVLLTK